MKRTGPSQLSHKSTEPILKNIDVYESGKFVTLVKSTSRECGLLYSKTKINQRGVPFLLREII